MAWLTRTVHLALILILAAASVAISAEARMYRGYEMPPYEVIAADGAIELRRYRPHLLAEVQVRGDRDEAISRGFRVLADYIFGGNAERRKVAMTVPVSQAPAEDAAAADGPWRVQFMMPSDYDRAALPAPDNGAIRFVRTEAETQAVIRFSGRWTDRSLAEKTAALTAWAETEGLTVNSPPRYYFYDGPFTLPFQRRNEVAIRVAPPV